MSTDDAMDAIRTVRWWLQVDQTDNSWSKKLDKVLKAVYIEKQVAVPTLSG